MNYDTKLEKQLFFSTNPSTETENYTNIQELDRINNLYQENHRFNNEITVKMDSLVEENQKLNSIIKDFNEKTENLLRIIDEKDQEISFKNQEISSLFQEIELKNQKILEKDKKIEVKDIEIEQKYQEFNEKRSEMDHLYNKIAFMENELGSRFLDYEKKFMNLNQNNVFSQNNEILIAELKEKIFEMTKDSQDSYNTILSKNSENNLLHDEITEIRIKLNDQAGIIAEFHSVLSEKDQKIIENVEILSNEIEIFEKTKKNFEKNLEKILKENSRLQMYSSELSKKFENLKVFFNEELQKKHVKIEEFEQILMNSDEKIANLTVGFALENLKQKEKIIDNEKIEEIACSAKIIENLNKLITEKIEENRFLHEENKVFKEEIEKLQVFYDEEISKKNTMFEKQQENLEKLLKNAEFLNMIINNQKNKINNSPKINEIIEEINHFYRFLHKEKDDIHDNFKEFFNDCRVQYTDLKEKIKEFKEKTFCMVNINENLIKIIEKEEKNELNSNEKKYYEQKLENLKKKIYLILEENAKLNTAFDRIDKNRIFKSWTESREKIESFSLQNELNKAKKNILLLLKNNKDLLEKYKKNQKNDNFDVFGKENKENDEKINHLLSENKEKYVFQINSLKKQIEILKVMNKNRGMVIENLMKKLKNPRIY